MKESLSAIPKQAVFRETFTDEQTTRLNGGVPTAVTYFNGVASFNGTASLLNFAKTLKGIYSIRLKFVSLVPSNGKYLIDFRTSSGVGYIWFNTGTTVEASTGTVYIDGLAGTNVSISAKEITISGITLTATGIKLLSSYLDSARTEGSIELFEIYDYTLTANEVKNLYEGKRNRIIDLQQTAPSSANYYQGVGVAGNKLSSNVTYASNNIEIEAVFSLNITTGSNIVVGGNGSNDTFFFYYDFSVNGIALTFNANSGFRVSYALTSFTNLDTFYVLRNATTGAITFKKNGTTLTTVGYQVAGNLDYSITQVKVGEGNCKVSRAKLFIAGTPVVDFNPQLYVSGTTLPSSTGETWTINGTQGFIGNGSRPEILNIDGRNGVIANKYNPENLVNYSEDFSNVIWNKGGTTINTDQTLSPINTLTADKFNETSTFDTHQIYRSFTGGVGTYTFSVYVKSAERSNIMLTIDKTNPDPTAFFNLSTGTVTSTVNSAIANIEKCADGWYRCSLTFQSTIAETFFPIIRNVISGITEVYTGIAGYGTYIWGAQLNQDTIKPYIQTFATNITSNLINTAVTPVRQGSVWAMDFNGSTSKLDCGNYDSLLGDISFVCWYKFTPNSIMPAARLFENNKIRIYTSVSTPQYLYITSDGATTVGSGIMTNPIKTWKQVIITRTSTGLVNFYINGILSGAANQVSGTPIAGTTNMFVGAYVPSYADQLFKGQINQVRIIKGILNAQECQQLFDNERHDYGI